MAAAAAQLVKEPSRQRHRAKPKFDIPVESAPAEAPKGWVYRGEAERVPPPLPGIPESDPLETIAEGLFLVGFGSLRLLYRAVSAPFRLADW
jgi:hypothetical protein